MRVSGERSITSITIVENKQLKISPEVSPKYHQFKRSITNSKEVSEKRNIENNEDRSIPFSRSLCRVRRRWHRSSLFRMPRPLPSRRGLRLHRAFGRNR